MTRYFNIVFYSSFAFLIIALIKANYLEIPMITDVMFLGFSFIFLFAGFIFNALSWPQILKQTNYPITNRLGIISVGLSVFGKYIPGKIWVILGRSSYLATKYPYSTKALSTLSLNTQCISLWTGLLLGIIGITVIGKINIYGFSALILFIMLSLFIYTSLFYNIGKIILSIVIKKPINIPHLSFYNVLRVLPWFFLYWLLWCIGFYFLVKSLVTNIVTFNVAWGFAFSVALGILAFIAPGGLGVREGMLTAYLTLAGLDITDATTVSVASRLWFLIGEFFILLLAVIFDKTNNPNRLNPG